MPLTSEFLPSLSLYLLFSYFGGSVLFRWICYLPMVVYALLIVVADKLYRLLALFLNDMGRAVYSPFNSRN